MAIGTPASVATLATGTDGTTFTSSSWSPTAGHMLFAFGQFERTTSDVEVPSSVTGHSLTWVSTATSGTPNRAWTTGGATNRRIFVYWAYNAGSPGAGTMAFNFTNTHIGGVIDVVSVSGVDPTAPIVQVVSGANTTGTTATATLAAYASANNRPLFAMALNANAPTAITPEGTEISELAHSTPTITFEDQYYTTTELTPSASWTGNQAWGCLALEMKEYVAPAVTTRLLGLQGVGT